MPAAIDAIDAFAITLPRFSCHFVIAAMPLPAIISPLSLSPLTFDDDADAAAYAMPLLMPLLICRRWFRCFAAAVSRH
jgi:hypothetical protein